MMQRKTKVLSFILISCVVISLFAMNNIFVKADTYGSFGYTTVGSDHETGASITASCNFTLSQDVSLTSITSYISNADTLTTGFAVYYSNLTLIAKTVTGVVSGAGAQWVTLAFSSPVALVAGQYRLAMYLPNPAWVYHNTLAGYTFTMGTGNLGDPMDTSIWVGAGYVMSIYANYTIPSSGNIFTQSGDGLPNSNIVTADGLPIGNIVTADGLP